MADSTAWTLEFIDHEATAIVLIPGVTEFAANYYYHLQDGGLDLSTPKMKRMWAGGGNMGRMGESLVSESYENRKVELNINIVATNREYAIDAFKGLYNFAYEVGKYASPPQFRDGYWYMKIQWLGVTDTIFNYAFLLACDVSPMPNLYGESGVNFYSGEKYIIPVTISIVMEPAFRNIAPLSDGTSMLDTSNTSGLYVPGTFGDSCIGDNFIDISGTIVGDIPPLVLMKFGGHDIISTNEPRKFFLAMRSAGDLAEFYNRVGVQNGTLTGGAELTYISTGTGPGRTELLGNPGFESTTAFQYWTQVVGDGILAVSNTVSRGGIRSALLTSGLTSNTYIYQDITVVAETTYIFNAFDRSGATPARYRIYDNTGAADIVALAALNGATASNAWLGTRDDFTTPVGCISVRVYIYCPASNGVAAYVDNVSVGESNVVEISPTGTSESIKARVDIISSSPKGVPLAENYFGTFRVRIRAKTRNASSVDDVGIRARWSAHDLTGDPNWKDVGDGSLVYADTLNQWSLIDLGKFTWTISPRALLGTSTTMSIALYTEHDTTGDYIDVDFVELVPADEMYGWVEVSEDPYKIVVEQYLPGEQDVWYEGLNAHELHITDHDIQHIRLSPGRDYRIYMAAVDENGAADKNIRCWIDVDTIEQRILIG